MWPFKKNKEDKDSSKLKWYDLGDENPFNAPILDIRDITLNMASTTKDPAIAEAYVANRSDDGTRHIATDTTSFASFESQLTYPHNGDELEGIIFKSPSMDVKWDLYAYGEFIYLARSWTGELVYKGKYSNEGDSLKIVKILTNTVPDSDTEKIAEQNFHSIMLTHAVGKVWPYYIPKGLRKECENEIAIFMFSNFGNKATIATNHNVLDIELIQQYRKS